MFLAIDRSGFIARRGTHARMYKGRVVSVHSVHTGTVHACHRLLYIHTPRSTCTERRVTSIFPFARCCFGVLARSSAPCLAISIEELPADEPLRIGWRGRLGWGSSVGWIRTCAGSVYILQSTLRRYIWGGGRREGVDGVSLWGCRWWV